MSWGPPPLPGDETVAVSRSGADRRRSSVALGAACALALAVVAGIVVLRDDDDPGDGGGATPSTALTDVTDGTEQTSPPTTPSAASVPPIVFPTTTVALTIDSTAAPTDPPATTLPTPMSTAPGPAADLGFGVFIPLPDGWEVVDGEGVQTITNGALGITAGALALSPGQDPALVLQEYISTFDGNFEAVSYRPSAYFGHFEGVASVDQYGVTYSTFDAAAPDGVGALGTAYVFVRADGLNVIYDVFAGADVDGGLEQSAFEAFRQSILDAPLLAEPVPLEVRPPFRVTTVHPFVQVAGLVGYAVAPGYTSTQRPDGTVFVENDLGGFEVQLLPETQSIQAAAALAIKNHNRTYRGLIYQQPTFADGPRDGIQRADLTWNGPVGGRPGFGAFSLFYDTTSRLSVVALVGWFDTAQNPAPSSTGFMFRSLVDSI